MSVHRLLQLTVLLITLVLLAGCNGPDNVPANESKTTWRLLDVTTSAGYKSSVTAESFWSDNGVTKRCFNDHVDNTFNSEDYLTLGAHDCSVFGKPKQLPADAILLAINMGHSQKNQSVWDIGDHKLEICNHSEDFWSGNITDVEGCADFPHPAQLDPRSMIVAFNSGSSQYAQSFWVNPDNTLNICNHDKEGIGFIGLEGTGFGAVKECAVFPAPTMLPVGKHWVMAGATSDDNRPAESFWQDDSGQLAQCQHQKEGDGNFFATYGFGPAVACWYWRAPQ